MIRSDRLAQFIGAVVMLASLGCGDTDFAATELAKCTVTIDGQPASDVRVLMNDPSDFLPALEGITDQMGIAEMRLTETTDFDSEKPTEFHVTVESLGDWQFKSIWSNPTKTPLRAAYVPGGDSITIEIPKKAVEHL